MTIGVIDRLLERVDGNKSELARVCGVNRSSVVRWVERGRVSRTAAALIDAHPDFDITKEELRPDVVEWTPWVARAFAINDQTLRSRLLS